MRRSTLIVSALLCAVCVVDSAAAQLPALQSGTRVRVTPGGRAKPTIGIVETLSTDAISLRGNGAVGSVIPLSSVSRLEISLGKKRPTWSKTAPLWMPLAGIGTGAAIGHLSESENNGLFGRDFAIAVFGGLGGIVGLVAGVVTGFNLKTEQWKSVPHTAGVGQAVGLSRAGRSRSRVRLASAFLVSSRPTHRFPHIQPIPTCVA